MRGQGEAGWEGLNAGLAWSRFPVEAVWEAREKRSRRHRASRDKRQ